MSRKLIIDGNAVYEIDEACMLKKRIDQENGKNQKEEANKKAYIEEYKKAIRGAE